MARDLRIAALGSEEHWNRPFGVEARYFALVSSALQSVQGVENVTYYSEIAKPRTIDGMKWSPLETFDIRNHDLLLCNWTSLSDKRREVYEDCLDKVPIVECDLWSPHVNKDATARIHFCDRFCGEGSGHPFPVEVPPPVADILPSPDTWGLRQHNVYFGTAAEELHRYTELYGNIIHTLSSESYGEYQFFFRHALQAWKPYDTPEYYHNVPSLLCRADVGLMNPVSYWNWSVFLASVCGVYVRENVHEFKLSYAESLCLGIPIIIFGDDIYNSGYKQYNEVLDRSFIVTQEGLLDAIRVKYDGMKYASYRNWANKRYSREAARTELQKVISHVRGIL